MPYVVVLCEYATLNGGEQSLLSVLSAIVANRFDVTVLAPAAGPLSAALAAAGVQHVPFELHNAAGDRLPQGTLRLQLRDALESLQPDLLHANSLAMGRLSGPVAESLQLPSVAHLRDIVGLSRAAVADLNCHRRLLAVSHATRTFHIAQGVDATKLHVLHNGVDLDQFAPREPSGYLHAELNLPAATPLVGNLGQLVLRKGQDVLVQAAVMLRNRLPQVHWVIVGERYSQKDEAVRYEEELHATLASAGLTERVHFLGARDDVPRLLNELTMLVHSARQEPLGRVLLEAAAAGLPIVATDVGGTREIFPAEAHAAQLVPADDPAALAATIEQLASDAALRRSLGTAARRRAENAFHVTDAATALLQHYKSVAGQSTGGTP